MRHIHAYALLAWHMVVHILGKLVLLYKPGGIERVRAHFEPEGLTPLEAEEREMIAKWQSCIGCGLCEAVCPELDLIPDQRVMGPSLLAQGGMRELSHSELTLPSAEALQTCDCDALEQICPVDIPLCDLAAFLTRLGEQIQAARQAQLPPNR
ncbi:MAG: 4Fe-4S dicluster domain-containing protein [Persicimonas sp.]